MYTEKRVARIYKIKKNICAYGNYGLHVCVTALNKIYVYFVESAAYAAKPFCICNIYINGDDATVRYITVRCRT